MSESAFSHSSTARHDSQHAGDKELAEESTHRSSRELTEEEVAYRLQLIEGEKQAQDDFDKTVLKLSGGALGVSFAFLKNVVGSGPYDGSWALLTAWSCWGLSLAFILISFYSSNHAFKSSITHFDSLINGAVRPGGRLAAITEYLNLAGGACFIVGVMAMIVFVFHNMEI